MLQKQQQILILIITGDAMKKINLFKNINEQDLENTLEKLNYRTISFKKSMTILSNLSNTNEVGIIIEGEASLIRIDYNGNKTIQSVLKENDLFGGSLTNYMNEEMSIISNTDCLIMFIEYNKLLSNKNIAPNIHSTIVDNMIEILVEKINNYSKRIEILNKRSIRDKLLEYFHMLEKDALSHTFYLPYTWTTLADYLSIDRSAMMREIKNLKDEGIIQVENKRITLIYR